MPIMMNHLRTKVINRAQNTRNLVDIVSFSPVTTQIYSFSNAKVNRAHFNYKTFKT